MINHFRRDIVRPIVGVAHSFGSSVIANLALYHPRLISALVLMDPVLSHFMLRTRDLGYGPMQASSVRRDVWDSREDAASSFRRNKFYQTWDPRVLDAWIRHGLRDTPSKLFPEPGKVTLTTTKHQEVFTYFRPQAQAWAPDGTRYRDPRKLPDIGADVVDIPNLPFYRAEGSLTRDQLPSLRPGVLWIYGGHSNVNNDETREEKMRMTGTGTGGSGGAKAGRVKEVVIEEFGHLVPLEATTRCAEYAADFIVPELKIWQEEQDEYQRWAQRPIREKQTIDDDWMRWMGMPQKKAPKL